MADYKRYLALVFKAGFEHWDKGEFVVTLIFLIAPFIVSMLLGINLQFSDIQWFQAIVGALLVDVIIIIPTKIGIRYTRAITPKLRLELEQFPDVNKEHIWWHLVVYNDTISPIEDCYAQVLSFTPNISKKLYQAIHLPWSSFGSKDMEFITIPGKSSAYCDVVMTNRKDLYVLTITNIPSQPLVRGTPWAEPPGTYAITIQVGSNKQAFMPSKIQVEAILNTNGDLIVKELPLT